MKQIPRMLIQALPRNAKTPTLSTQTPPLWDKISVNCERLKVIELTIEIHIITKVLTKSVQT